ncbi:MAG: LysR family transcriptional regulator [Elusimicrobiales bacterium]|nr:LysR family transcriptional regulator [Elusimicrobiales bacterium]
MALNLYQLKAFFTVAQTRNFTEASKRLYLTQSAVSHAVNKLGKSAGDELFNKTSKGLEMTEAGRILYKACETVFFEIEKAEEHLAAVKNKNLGSIRLGATVEFGTTLLVKYLKVFIEKNPRIHIDFQFRHELLKPLLNEELDVIIDCTEHDSGELLKTPLFREEYAVIASPGYLRKHRIRQPADLAGHNILSMDKEGKWWGNFLNALPAAGRPELSQVTEMNHIRAMINAAIEDLGVGFVPRYCVMKELKAKILADVFPKLKLFEGNFYIYQKAKRAGLERHRSLVEYLKNIKSTHLERA